MCCLLPTCNRKRADMAGVTDIVDTQLDQSDQRGNTTAMKVMRRQSLRDSFSIVSNPLPHVPPSGARVKVCFAGACIVDGQLDKDGQRRLRMPGVLDTSLFQGFEVSGVIDEMGSQVPDSDVKANDRVVVYPRDLELTESGFAEYVTVRHVEDLIKVPDELTMQTAATLPAGGLRAYSAVLQAKQFIEQKLLASSKVVVVMIAGAGAIGLLTLKLARHCIPTSLDRIHIAVADTNLKKLQVAKDQGCSEIIHWDEAIHEEYIAMRTRDGCHGGADVIIDLVSSPRSITRSMSVLNESGVILVGGNSQYEVLFDLARLAYLNQSIVGVPQGTREQLKELVQIYSQNQGYSLGLQVFPLAEADRVFDMLSQGQIDGRAVLEMFEDARYYGSNASGAAISM